MLLRHLKQPSRPFDHAFVKYRPAVLPFAFALFPLGFVLLENRLRFGDRRRVEAREAKLFAGGPDGYVIAHLGQLGGLQYGSGHGPALGFGDVEGAARVAVDVAAAALTEERDSARLKLLDEALGVTHPVGGDEQAVATKGDTMGGMDEEASEWPVSGVDGEDINVIHMHAERGTVAGLGGPGDLSAVDADGYLLPVVAGRGGLGTLVRKPADTHQTPDEDRHVVVISLAERREARRPRARVSVTATNHDLVGTHAGGFGNALAGQPDRVIVQPHQIAGDNERLTAVAQIERLGIEFVVYAGAGPFPVPVPAQVNSDQRGNVHGCDSCCELAQLR